MNLYGNEPDFPVVATGTCAVCKRIDVSLRETKDGRNDVCADLTRCAMALIGVDDEILRAEMPPGEMWLVETSSPNPAYDPNVAVVETVDYGLDGSMTRKVETVSRDDFFGWQS